MSDIANQPHVVAFANDNATLLPCYAFGEYGAIDPKNKYAIYADREAADLAVRHWALEGGPVYFSVPVTALFPDFIQHDPDGPLTDDQRRALFASFGAVFGQREADTRYAFTRMVLGKSANEYVSWSSHKYGTLTYAEASKVLDALNVLDV